MEKLTKNIPGLGSWGSRSSLGRLHMMRSGRSDPMMMVRDADNDDNEVENEEQETFVLPAAGPDNNIRYEKRSGSEKVIKIPLR